MKAYICRQEIDYCSTIIFAETAGKARYIAICSDSIGDDLEFKDVFVRRVPQMDKYYHGLKEMDWLDDNDRIAMVRDAGFQCDEDSFDPDHECKRCPAKEYCGRYEDWMEEIKEDEQNE